MTYDELVGTFGQFYLYSVTPGEARGRAWGIGLHDHQVTDPMPVTSESALIHTLSECERLGPRVAVGAPYAGQVYRVRPVP